MNIHTVKMAFCVVFSLCITGFSQQDAPQPDSTGLDITRLNWLAGYWEAGEGDASSEEFWLPAAGNLMLGLHRDIFTSGKTFFEFLRIVETESGLSYFASPKGREATEFKAIRLDRASVTFENPDHDFPQRIIYTLAGPDTLIMRIEGISKGKKRFSEWQLYRRNLPF